LTRHGIATQLGLSLGSSQTRSIEGRARGDLGGDLALTPEVAEQLIGLWRDGLSQSAIADRQETTESVTSERIKLLRARGVDLSARRAPPTWTQKSILRALRLWADQHGRLPNCADWRQASDGHPSVVTV
jgi:uncharacterized protein (DUF2237 family)